ncbi:hypothetical protein E4T66_13430 [Sinimarinibacterium sp. CAU 1509]|uniref:tetratricopeptide repeat protein n=1 Tax=Sinimarinibacterium sp. CAU 1509 TaxID=2562283 RepID=UPI0010AD4FD2|nr:hypothetical protein [Sinimarinibacterium sp. CAU 1509]TJY59392.1 hypothetical protein E4T66_13430 [Sinimarinibacterium sp. CAU 1509]
MSFFSELRRRNVIRMAGLYLVGAWLIMQVAETLLPIFQTPDWVLRTLVLVLALGLIPALVFSWLFELTPEGFKLDSDVAPSQSIAPQTARRMDRAIIAALTLALVYFCIDKFALTPHQDASPEAEATSTTDAHSIAVLPFVNMSGDVDNEYFSDGISEEILNVLAGTPELQVAARTSSFSFKGKAMEVPDIARALNVRMVLEGSVRKQSTSVRITAQLIDAKTGFHLWSQTFDRKLEDIFAIQDEIARAIGAALKVTIGNATTAEPHASAPKDIAAYDMFLRGMALWHTRGEDNLWAAVDLFKQAVAADPVFAQAYAGLALAYTILPAYSSRISWDQGLQHSDEAALRALALDPSLPEPFAALGNTSTVRLQRENSIALLRRAVMLRPSSAAAHHWLGNALASAGNLAEGLAELERASVLDPRSGVIAENHAYSLLAAGRIADARARCQALLDIIPDHPSCLQYVALGNLLLGEYGAADATLAQLAATFKPAGTGGAHELVEALAGRADRRTVAERMAALPPSSNLSADSANLMEDHVIAAILMMLGEPELALSYTERLASVPGNVMDWAVMLPMMDPIRCEPRFRAVIEKLKTHDPYVATVCPAASTVER